MHHFIVLAANEVIGHTNLEYGDPPMGVAFGGFVPNARYKELRTSLMPNPENGACVAELSLQAPNGDPVPCQGGVGLIDQSGEYGPDAMEIEALGIPYPLYEQLFPGHVLAYESKFR